MERTNYKSDAQETAHRQAERWFKTWLGPVVNEANNWITTRILTDPKYQVAFGADGADESMLIECQNLAQALGIFELLQNLPPVREDLKTTSQSFIRNPVDLNDFLFILDNNQDNTREMLKAISQQHMARTSNHPLASGLRQTMSAAYFLVEDVYFPQTGEGPRVLPPRIQVLSPLPI